MIKFKLKEFEGKSATNIIEGLGIGFGVNDWGSCQYTGVLNTFNALNILSEHFGEKTALRLLNLKFSHGRKRSIKEASRLHWNSQNERTKEEIQEEKRYIAFYKKLLKGGKLSKKQAKWWKPRKTELPATIQRAEKRLKTLQKRMLLNGDEMLNYCRNSGWDLWGAAPHVANMFLPNFKVSGVMKAPGVGPKWNVLAQSCNYEVGAKCWYLMKKDIVMDEKSFGSFDT